MGNNKKIAYDIIGDIHGREPELIEMLVLLGYSEIDGVWQHENNVAIFLGDFIDRGKFQREVINIVRPMVEGGHALSVMGNHELNAIAYFTPDGSGNFIRPRSKGNTLRHKAFIDAYKNNYDEWESTIEWFKTLPLWIDLGDFRCIHAYWGQDDIDSLGTPVFDDEVLLRYSNKKSDAHKSIERVLKGVEIEIPDGLSFVDKEDKVRTLARIKWWLGSGNIRDIAIGDDEFVNSLPDKYIDFSGGYAANEVPVFIGHYWQEGEVKPLTENVVCLD